MKKYLVLLVCFLALSNISNAQNWSGVVTNRVSYYDQIKSNLKDQIGFISIDSTVAVGSNTEFYFCNTFRELGNFCGTIKGASWMGDKFVHTPLGDEYYFNQLADSILIKTQAGLNGTWTLATDTNGISYVATVISLDTMTINNIIDSVKTINLQAFNGSNAIASIYNVNLKLSKNNGMVALIPWFGFPYLPSPNVSGGQTIFPFTGVIHYYDSNSVFYKNYGSFDIKYQAGNEWITRCDSSIYFSYFSQDSSKSFAHDSIISSVLLPTGSIAFASQRTEYYQVGAVQVYLNQSIINDTINAMQSNPLFNQSIMQVCPNYLTPINGSSFITPRNMNITFGLDSLGRNTLAYLDEDVAYLGMSVYLGDTCFGFVHNLGPVYGKKKIWAEGFGLLLEATLVDDFNSGIINAQQCSLTYSNINGQVYGNKNGFFLNANAFELSLKNFGSGLKLAWQTVNENNVDHFTIERSYDAIHFTKIGNQASLGNNIESNQYEFIEANFQKKQFSTIYYRIKMNDIDGKVFYSNVVKYQMGKVNEVIVHSIFSNQIAIHHLLSSNQYEIQLLDAMGRSVVRKNVINQNEIQINGLGHLSNGIYFLSITNLDLGTKQNFKLIKSN